MTHWNIRLTVGLMGDVKLATKIDLSPDDDKNISALSGLKFQSRTLAEVLWNCCKDESTTREQFFASLDGETLAEGWRALVDAVIEFARSKDQGLAAAIREAIDMQLQVVEATFAANIEMLRSDETQKAMQKAAVGIGEQMRAEMLEGFRKVNGKR